MDCRTIGYVVSVADAGNFRIAANRCHVSTPTLSIQIKALEDTLGVRLFDRSVRPVCLTEQGRELLPHFREICRAVGAVRGYSMALRCARFDAGSIRGFLMEVGSGAADNGPQQPPAQPPAQPP